MIKRIYICAIIMFLFSTISVSADNTKILHLKFDGNYKDEVSGKECTHYGDSSFIDSSLGKAAYFDGDGDYLDLGTGYNLTDDYSVCVWLKPECKNRNYPAIFAKYEKNHYGPYAFYLEKNKPALWVSDGKGSYKTYLAKNALSDNVWVHVVFTYKKSSSTLKIYVNGEEWGEYNTIPMTSGSDTVTVGRQALMFSPYSTLQYQGYMDDLRVYASSLSAVDIKTLSEGKEIDTKSSSSSSSSSSSTSSSPLENYTGEGLKPLTVTSSTMDQTIKTSRSEEIKGSSYPLLQARAINVKTTSFKLKWNKIPEATKYIVYGNRCGKKNRYEYITETTKTFYKAKKLKKKTFYKYIVMAVKDDKVVSVSKTVHVGTKTKQNPTKIKVNKTYITLQRSGAGSTFQIKAKIKGTTLKQHRGPKYETDNVNVATVDKTGKITAIGKGTCNIYCYAQNGVCAKIVVTVM